MLTALTSAPLLTRNRTTSQYPPMDAYKTAVRSRWSTVLTSAPRSTRY
ncbi:hypothetical protein PHMEG_0004901 [Phytophthora megakarya]|uniref:Uncharacterized protein n=1 Tax=Phytophthora megakarya TaxID=4795 RepID=A0A225WSN4_9STRA|nr:hypothetical protein PHMEG_0004901 [Phytophthora megakarya]